MLRTKVGFTGTLPLALLLAFSSTAVARQDPSMVSSQTGPLVLSPVSSSIVFSPDAKVTTIDGRTAVLAGAYGGKLLEKAVLVGVGAYWLADPRDDARMFYGGVIVGGRVLGTDRVNISLRGLAGAGQATVFRTFQLEDARHNPGHGKRVGASTLRSGVRDGFMLVEPEIRLLVGITDTIVLNLGAGYRATSSLRELLRGPTGSVGVQFNFAN